MWLTRAGEDGADDSFIELHHLTTMERRIVAMIDDYQRATGEGCPASVIARRLHRHHSTIQSYLSSLHHKGWLRAPNAPAFLRRIVN